MLLEIGMAIQGVEAFFKSCFCHPERLEARLLEIREPFGRRSKIKCREHCCMSGRVGPRCAAGELHKMVSDLFAEHHMRVLEHTMELDAIAKGKVIEDFECARSHVWFVFQEKYAIMLAIPHKFMALGHHDEDEARAKAVEILEALLDARAAHETSWDRLHPLIHFFYGHLNALAEFAAGQRTRRELPPDILDKAIVLSHTHLLTYSLTHLLTYYYYYYYY